MAWSRLLNFVNSKNIISEYLEKDFCKDVKTETDDKTSKMNDPKDE